MLVIGEKKAGVQYKKRVCAYAIVERNEDEKIAIVTDKPGVYFLLGGGLENDETEEKALKREVIEEVGFTLKNVKLFDKINSYCYSEKYGYIDVQATIYIAKFDKKIAEPIEKDHKLIWVCATEYKDKIYHEFQRYILNKYIFEMTKNVTNSGRK